MGNHIFSRGNDTGREDSSRTARAGSESGKRNPVPLNLQCRRKM